MKKWTSLALSYLIYLFYICTCYRISCSQKEYQLSEQNISKLSSSTCTFWIRLIFISWTCYIFAKLTSVSGIAVKSFLFRMSLSKTAARSLSNKEWVCHMTLTLQEYSAKFIFDKCIYQWINWYVLTFPG